MKFEQFLQEKGLAESSISSYAYSVRIFTDWMKTEGITAATYPELLDFIKARRSAGESRNLIASRLTAIRWWLRWQKSEGLRAGNPAEGLYLKGSRRRLPRDLLEPEQLEQLYKDYPTETLTDQRNKTMLGVLVWQGLTTGELARLEPEHVNLEKGTVRILPTSQSNARTLALKPFQVLQLYKYQHEVRPKLLEKRGTENPQLFLSTGSSPHLNNTLQGLAGKLRDQYSFFTGFGQLRASRIAIWVNQCNLREAQYRAGHKYVSSTERYLLGNLDHLKEAVEIYHPLSGDSPRS